jgi:hypothetical protein
VSDRSWHGQSFLDELRPAPGWHVELAFFATYSIDLSALGATLLALCGQNDETGSGSIANFAHAIETMRGRVSVMVQRGRIARPMRLPTVAGILDQFVVEIGYDEETRSWHPKAALVRYGRDDGIPGTTWRLWLGSRNLTRSANLDAGLMVETAAGKRRGSRAIRGIGRVANLLTANSHICELDCAAIAAELDGARWLAPEGIEVVSLYASELGTAMSAGPPGGQIDAITIVSPFLDVAFLKAAAKWGTNETRRTLVSTRQALTAVAKAKSHPLRPFERLLALDAPDVPLENETTTNDAPDVGSIVPHPAEPDEDADPQSPSIHAKLFCFESGGRATLLVGSANATSRAWTGRNTELLAEIRGGTAMTAGLAHLVGSASIMNLGELERAPLPEAAAGDALEAVRRRLVAAWSPCLVRDDAAFAVEVAGLFPDIPEGIELRVGLATGELQLWPTGATRLALGDIPLSRQTDLLQCQLRAENAALGWMQRAPVTPPLDPERDAAALSNLLGFAAFQSWMKQLLSGSPIQDEGTRWDQGVEGAGPDRSGFASELLTLEDVIDSWGTDPGAFRRADAYFDRYVDALLQQGVELTDVERTALDELRTIWKLARERLRE